MEGHGGIQLDEKMFEEAKYGHLASARVGISRNAFSNQLLDSLRRARQIVSSNIKVLDYYVVRLMLVILLLTTSEARISMQTAVPRLHTYKSNPLSFG